jgi:hypothetical protein
MSSTSVIKFPRKFKQQPKPPAETKPLPWWQKEANWILNRCDERPEFGAMIGDHTLLFVHQMSRWPSPPSPKQGAWLAGTGDMIEAKLEQIKKREAAKTPTTSTPGAA